MLNPKQEAEILVGVLHNKYGSTKDKTAQWIDGKDSILEMKNGGSKSWREMEWPGHYIKYSLQEFCKQNSDYEIVPFDKFKWHLVKGNVLWDARAHDVKKKETPLGAVKDYNDFILNNKGIGVIVVEIEIQLDRDGIFTDWHESIKGKTSKYSNDSKQLGRRSHPRKEKVRIKRALAYFFEPSALERGVAEGWARNDFQEGMKNMNFSKRSGKYEIISSKVPEKYLILKQDF